MNKLGVLIIGASGCIGSTLAVGFDLFKQGVISDVDTLGMLTNENIFKSLDIISIDNMVLSGWDFKPSMPMKTCLDNKIFSNYNNLKHLEQVKALEIYDGILTQSDYLFNDSNIEIKEISYENYIEKIRTDISKFKSENNLSNVIILNISSPHKNILIQDWHHDKTKFFQKIKDNDPNITSSMLYCIGGICEGCGFIEFTPSATLEAQAIIDLAIEKNIPLAGRDGSTGQTLLKYVLSPMFKARNLEVKSWYSTNILGNNDGKVLSNSDYSDSKMHDKSHGIKINLGYDIEQIIDIKFMANKKDNKESWDLVDFNGWMNEEMSVRVNWIGKDSILASPLIVDLLRLLEHSQRHKKGGLQKHLGVYFKNPMQSSTRNFFELFEQFIQHYKEI